MEHPFKGKTVLVTGAGWGIGAAAALLYAATGAKVIVSDTSDKGGETTLAKIINQKGHAVYINADVSNQAACEELIKRSIKRYGNIDIACNNSAIFCETRSGLNLTSLDNCMQYEVEAMQNNRGGVIINALSVMGAVGQALTLQYIEAKYGKVRPIDGISGATPAVHVHTIAPSYIAAALLNEKLKNKMEVEAKLFPPADHGCIQEVARLVLWLSSDETRLLSSLFNDTN